jgi:Double zinc ribbon
MDLAAYFSKLSRPMLPLAYFGIESSGLNLAVDLLIVFVAVIYLALVYWTYADARRRIHDPFLVGCATVASLFPFAGTVVYMILRPPEYLEDVRERELETQAAEARLRELDQTLCPHCSYHIENDFIRCPSCLRKLKERCASCSRPLDQAWTICPYCEADVPGLSAPRSRRRRAGASPALDGELTDLDISAVSDETEAKPAEPALATEPAPRTRSSSRAGRRPRPSDA